MIRRIIDRLIGEDDEPLEFDSRYIVPVSPHKDKEHLFDSYIAECKKIIESAKIRPDRPKSMTYYDELFSTDKLRRSLAADKRKERKIVGYFCNLVPEELIYAAGGRPIRLCSGCKESIKCAETEYPRDCCDLIKSSLGFAVAGEPFASICDSIVIPATCDGKKKLGEVLSRYGTVWMLDLPQSKERSISKRYWLAETRILAKRLVSLTGRKITRRALEESIRLLDERNGILQDLTEQRKRAVISGMDAIIVMQAAFYDDITSWMAHTRHLIEDLKKMKSKYDGCPRLLVTGSPVIMPNLKIPQIIESHGGVLIMEETCAGSQYGYDRVVPDDWTMPDMMQAISERYLMPSVCPCFIKSEDRMDRILNLVKDCRIDGVVSHVIRLCLPFDVEQARVRHVLEKERIPCLSINSDYSQEDTGQLRTRIEAFIEMLHARK